VSKFLTAHQHN